MTEMFTGDEPSESIASVATIVFLRGLRSELKELEAELGAIEAGPQRVLRLVSMCESVDTHVRELEIAQQMRSESVIHGFARVDVPALAAAIGEHLSNSGHLATPGDRSRTKKHGRSNQRRSLRSLLKVDVILCSIALVVVVVVLIAWTG